MVRNIQLIRDLLVRVLMLSRSSAFMASISVFRPGRASITRCPSSWLGMSVKRRAAFITALMLSSLWSGMTRAETILRAWQDHFYHVSAYVDTGQGERSIQSYGLQGVPGNDQFQAVLASAGNPNTGSPNTHASVSVETSATVDGNVITYGGSLLAQAANQYGYAHTTYGQYLSFDIVDEPETVTVSVANATRTVLETPPGRGFAASDFGIIGNGFTDCTACNYFPLQSGQIEPRTMLPGHYQFFVTAAVTAQLPLAVESRFLQSTIVFSNTISFTNLTFGPGSIQSNPLLPVNNIFTDAQGVVGSTTLLPTNSTSK